LLALGISGPSTQIVPGTRKAARQPNPLDQRRGRARSERWAEIAAHATLKASERPRKIACSISMAMPTG
jgi:hypothetical protein